MQKDYYKILRVDPSAEQEIIEAAYKRLALMYHPDVNKSPNATRLFQEINEAYETLKSPQKREKYDFDQKIIRTQDNSEFDKRVDNKPPSNVNNNSYSSNQSEQHYEDKRSKPDAKNWDENYGHTQEKANNRGLGKNYGKVWLALSFFLILAYLIFKPSINNNSSGNLTTYQGNTTSPNVNGYSTEIPSNPTIIPTITPTLTPVYYPTKALIAPTQNTIILQPYLNISKSIIIDAYKQIGIEENTPFQIANNQTRTALFSPPENYRSSAMIILEGYGENLCKANVLIVINDLKEKNTMLKYLAELPQIICPNWDEGLDWMTKGVNEANASTNGYFNDSTYYNGMKFTWTVQKVYQSPTLRLDLSSRCGMDF